MAELTHHGETAILRGEIGRLRAIIKKAARELYALEVRRQSMGWEDGMTERLIALQHELAAEHNDGVEHAAE